MIDRSPEARQPALEEPTDWNALMIGYDWKINIPTDPDDPAYTEGLDMVSTLREQYGEENVLATRAAMDSDTAQLTKIPGRLGVFVRAGIEPSDGV